MKYKVDDEVYWNDPDEGISSGVYRIVKVMSEEIYLIADEHSEHEVFEHELD